MSKHVVEFDEKCKSCKGTGLYVGLAERDGAAVECDRCKGTGCHHFKIEYEDFEGRQPREGIVRVYEVNPGIALGRGNGHELEDFGGMSHADWENDMLFPSGSENRLCTCPAWWYQSADYKKKPDWDDCRCGGTFSSCKSFVQKEECWKRFDKEQTNA